MNKLPPPPPATSAPKPTAAKPPGIAFERIKPGPCNTRIVINMLEGFGKTTLMAYSPKPVIIRAPEESGFVTLRKADRVPDVPTIVAGSWPDLMALIKSPELHGFDTVCLDALGGFEELARLHVLRTCYEGNEDKYVAYGKGNQTTANLWMTFLSALEALSNHASIILASHTRVHRSKNPMGEDFDRFTADCHEKVWAPTKRWADAVFFGTFFTIVDQDGKGKGGADRVVYTEHRATHDAKNRWGMPPSVKIPNDPTKVYETLFSHIPTRSN